MSVALSNFARRRHTPTSGQAHFEGDENQLLNLVNEGLTFGRTTPGYRDGVVLVSVPAEGFFSGTVLLTEGDRLVGAYEPRHPGEAPRKSIRSAEGWKTHAKFVQIVLYSHAVLMEGNEASSDADWEIVSINASDVEDEPMSPETLMANHFHVAGSNDGGTMTGMSDAEFVAALKTSYTYWKDRAISDPQ